MEFAGLIEQWAKASMREWGDELDYPHKAAFVQMQGGSIPLPPTQVEHVERIGRAIWNAGRVERLVIHGHFRRRASYRRIADALTAMTGRTVYMREVGRLVANAIDKAEREYQQLEEIAA